jgi:uncharacterized phiE125 gp8 family phage protein
LTLLLPPSFADRSTAVRLPLVEGETAPPEPVTQDEIREELRIALTDEAHRIENNAIAAREWIERQYGLALIPGRHRCLVTASRNGRLDLPIHPVTAVLAVSSRDHSDGESDAVDSDDFWSDLDYRPARVWVGGCGTYVVTCTTGWTRTTIPQALKQAIAYHVWGSFDGVATADWRRAVDVLVRPFAVRGL